MQDGARVIGYNENGERVVLREGTNRMICWADDPNLSDARGAFFVNCFPKSLEAFENRRQEPAEYGPSNREERMRMRAWLATLVASLLLLGTALPAQQATSDELIARIEGTQVPDRQGLDALTIEELMERFGVPGVSIAVIHDFTIHWAKGYGVADVETGARVDSHTLFQAASISKPVAAMATLKGAAEGHFDLDDDINTILTSWRVPANEYTHDQPVTPRGLLSHPSGAGDGFGFPGYEPGDPTPTLVQILDGHSPSNVGPVLIVRPPLTAHHYSGGGVTMMQRALMDVLGRPFEEILADAVLRPVGMVDSTFEQPLPAARDETAARAHGGRGQAMGPKWHVYPELAAAGLWTTPSDLARLVIDVQRALQGDRDRALSPTMAQLMVTPVGVGDFGLGFQASKRGQGWYFGHGGSNWGFRAQVIAHKLKGYGAVVMTNAERGSAVAQELIARVERAYGWDALDNAVVR